MIGIFLFLFFKDKDIVHYFNNVSSQEVVYVIIIFAITLIDIISIIATVIGNIKFKKQDQLSPQKTPSANTDLIFNAISDGVVTIDGQGIIKLINPAAEQIIGWTRQDGVSLHYQSVIKLLDKNDENLSQDKDPIWQALNYNQQIINNDLFLVSTSGKKINLALIVSPIGQPGSGLISVFRDTTKERTEEREKAEFISTASHEMRTPVAAINGYLGLAINPQTAQIDDRARNYIKKAQDATEHLGQLFQDLLDISKVDDGRLENNPEPIDIVAFVKDIIEGLEPKAKEKNLRIIFNPLARASVEKIVMPSYIVKIDRNHIREVLDNLIENAIKYTLKGQVEIDVLGTDEFITISIKDTGIGIPGEDIPHLFQKFYRVSNKQADQISGNGLGLYLCRRLIETIGGRIWVESLVNSGSTFFVELPRAPELTEIRLDDQASRVEKIKPATIQSATIEDVKRVPRSSSLSKEQIANYVSRQRQLVQQQTPNQPAIAAPTQVAPPAQATNVPDTTQSQINQPINVRQAARLNIPPRR